MQGTDYDFEAEAKKVDSGSNILAVKDGERFRVIVEGPTVTYLDSYPGETKLKQKTLVGVFVLDKLDAKGQVLEQVGEHKALRVSFAGAKSTGASMLAENKERPFKTHTLIVKRTGAGKQDTVWTFRGDQPITDAQRAQQGSSPRIDLQQIADSFTSRAQGRGAGGSGEGGDERAPDPAKGDDEGNGDDGLPF